MLVQDLRSGDGVVVPAGAALRGRLHSTASSGRLLGSSYLRLELRELEIDGMVVPLSTADYGLTPASADSPRASDREVVTESRRVKVPEQTLLEFILADALTLDGATR